jgi:serine/threonine-protein kinase RsbW
MALPMSRSPAGGDPSEWFVLHDRDRDIAEVQGAVAQQLARHNYEATARFAIRLALEEALTNAFRHGCKDDPEKTVRFRFSVDSHEARFEIEDDGTGFDPASVPDPTDDANIEIPSGRGIMLIRAYMSEVEFLPPGNRLMMKFRRS